MDFILKYVSEQLSRRDIHLFTAGFRIMSLNRICLHEVSLVRQGHALTAGNTLIYYSIWQSLFNRKLIGEIKVNNVRITSELISEAPLIIPHVTLSFTFGRKVKLLLIELRDIIPLFFQLTEDKQQYDLYFQSEELTWNSLKKLLEGHLHSGFLKNAHSDSKISIYARLQLSKIDKDAVPAFRAKVEHENFAIQSDESPEKTIENREISIPLKDIPQILIDAVICTEDPDFRNHRGINPHFVGYALRENLQKKKFARGASTITMQLVRNLFLSHERTIVRKLEEVIIALLLENIYKINKEKLLEIYLNIIEFAPEVYGIYDGSMHYFGKQPSELSLTEALVLTYIIPRPVFFEEALVLKTKQLQKNLRNHIKSYAYTMYSRKLISKDEYRSLTYKVRFSNRFGELDLSNDAITGETEKTKVAPWMRVAWAELEYWATHNLTIKDNSGYSLAQKYIDITGEYFSPDSNGWCGCFVDWVFKCANLQYDTVFSTVELNPAFSLNYVNPERFPNSYLIKPTTQKPPYGSIVVLHKDDSQGHVGFVANYLVNSDRIFVHILSGNQCNRVCVQEFEIFLEGADVKYKTEKGTLFNLLGYVCPKEYQLKELGETAYEYDIPRYDVKEKIV